MKIKKIEFWYNSLWAYYGEICIEIDSGKVRFKTNFDYDKRMFSDFHIKCMCNQNKLPIHESFFTVHPSQSNRFAQYAERVFSWLPYYGKGHCIDGQYWSLSVELSDGTTYKCIGENGAPDDFNDFVEQLEKLIGKQIAYRPSCSQ